MTQGVDGGPGLSGLVVQTNTSLGLLLPSMFDAMSCGDKKQMVEVNGRRHMENGRRRGLEGRRHKRLERREKKAEDEGNCADEREPLPSAPSSAVLILPFL